MAASLAPVAVSLALWALTQSLFALMFAVLGPVVAVAGVLDGHRHARKRRRHDASAYEQQLREFRAAVAARHLLERDAASWETPSARQILASDDDPLRWRDTTPGLVSLGTGAMPSAIPLRGADADPQTVRWVRRLEAAPVTAQAVGGIGIVGPLALGRACARAIVLQLCHALPPELLGVVPGTDPNWAWMRLLPHQIPEASAELCVTETAAVCPQRAGSGPRVLIALAARMDELAPGCHTVVRLSSHSSIELVRWPAQRPDGTIRPELVAASEARRYALTLSRQATAAGLTGRSRLPQRVDYATLAQPQAPGAATEPSESLSVAIGVGSDGPVLVDLVGDGPHAIVAGTTGSGKSELLVSWVLALAAIHPPEVVAVLLVDFKGGAAFAPLTDLPHCVGLITDLDEHEAQRALESLSAELRYREQVLRDHRVRDIRELPGGVLARLVIVVDEFSAMLELSGELHALFVDVAARGRSLGVHLVLCTQRPVGVVRDALAANCALRLSFRVNNAADSSAVIGSAEAATLDPARHGRGLLSGVQSRSGAGGPILVQVALSAPADILAVARKWAGSSRPRRPWLEPVDAVVPLEGLYERAAAGTPMVDGGESVDRALLLGLSDDPRGQRHGLAWYRPGIDGGLFVVGAAASGKTSLLRVLWAQRPPGGGACVIAADPEQAWDAIRGLCEWLDRAPIPHRRRLVLIDDVDSLLARCPDEHAAAMREMVERILRDGARSGLGVVISARRSSGAAASLHSLCGSTLLLAMPNRTEHQLAGGDTQDFEAAARPGSCSWRGLRTQVAWIDPIGSTAATVVYPPVSSESAPLYWPRPGTTTAVISRTSTRRASALRAASPEAVIHELGTDVPPAFTSLDNAHVIVGDPEAWQAEWSLLSGLRRTSDLLFEGASLAEMRLLGGHRTLPPLLIGGSDRAILMSPDGRMSRVRLDGGHVPPSGDVFDSTRTKNF